MPGGWQPASPDPCAYVGDGERLALQVRCVATKSLTTGNEDAPLR
jgi:hypothetical protein